MRLTKKRIQAEYLDWLMNVVNGESEYHSRYYYVLFNTLQDREFTWTIELDLNRMVDGLELRGEFASAMGYDYRAIRGYFEPHCTVLEMMVALAKRMEDGIMGDEAYGDRTPKWFWGMIHSLGLYSQDDGRFNNDEIQLKIDKFLARDYQPNGTGGLFIVNNGKDLRKVEIWCQMCWYLDTLIENEFQF